jgi:autotransporter adhesin
MNVAVPPDKLKLPICTLCTFTIGGSTTPFIPVEEQPESNNKSNIDESNTALGKEAFIRSVDAVAVGKYASVAQGAQGSIALGAYSKVNSGVQNSVALGQYSVASESNTISVGNDTLKRRITNVNDGVNPYDAVNMRQLNKVDSRISSVGAMASAMSSMVPNHRIANDTQLSVGLGYYDGEGAVAA